MNPISLCTTSCRSVPNDSGPATLSFHTANAACLLESRQRTTVPAWQHSILLSASTMENRMAIKPMRKTALFRPMALVPLVFCTALHSAAIAADDWAGYERLDREKVVQALAGTA